MIVSNSTMHNIVINNKTFALSPSEYENYLFVINSDYYGQILSLFTIDKQFLTLIHNRKSTSYFYKQNDQIIFFEESKK